MSPIYTIFAGVNGAGKSTLYKSIPDEYGVRVNVDDIAKEKGHWSDSRVVYEAAKEAVKAIDHCIQNAVSFNQETTLAGHSVLKTIEKAKSNNFEVSLIYLFVDDVDICLKRIDKRVADGGHGIPEDLVRERYTKSLINLEKAIILADNVMIYDHSNKIRLLCSIVNDKIEYLDEQVPLLMCDLIYKLYPDQDIVEIAA